MFDDDWLIEALNLLGQILAERELRFDVVVVGGAALLLLGLSIRPTQDLDLIAEHLDGHLTKLTELPPALKEAKNDVARALGLAESWLNSAPSSLLDLGLPEGFLERTVPRTFGGMTLRLASRSDQIAFKLFAAADQGIDSKHAADLRQLDPSREEIKSSIAWILTQVAPEGFVQHDLNPLLRAMGWDPIDEPG